MSLVLLPDPKPTLENYRIVDRAPGRDDIEAGRIYKQTAPDGRSEQWFWGLAFPFTINEPKPFYGIVESRSEAMLRFRQCWERKPRIP